MDPFNSQKIHRWLATALILTGIGIVIFWFNFYTAGNVCVRRDEIYMAFESSFLLADIWLAVCALIGGVGLFRKKHWGFFFSLLAAPSCIFLALMDFKFNMDQNIYSAFKNPAVFLEIMINVFLLSLGIAIIKFAWREMAERLAL